MRRFLFWYLPVLAALATGSVLAYGFYLGTSSRAGGTVGAKSVPVATVGQKRDELRPLLLGDSVAFGAGDETGLGIGGSIQAELTKRQRTVKPAVNLAINGSRTPDLLQQLRSPGVKRLIGESNVIIVSIGGNDFSALVAGGSKMPQNPDETMGKVMNRMGAIVDTIRTASPTARIYLVGLYNPFRESPFAGVIDQLVSRWNASLIRKFQNDSDVIVIQTQDIFSHRDRLGFDRFHPGSEAYRMIARRITDSL